MSDLRCMWNLALVHLVAVATLTAQDVDVDLALHAALPGTNFGRAVALDGDVLAIAEPTHPGGGRVHVFERTSDGAWLATALITAPGETNTSWFGSALDLDGERLAIGAPAFATATGGTGAVFVYERNADATWSAVALPPSASSDVVNEALGLEVELDGDLLVCLIRGPVHDCRFRVFERAGDGTWSERATLPGFTLGFLWDAGVALEGDEIVAVGTPSTLALDANGLDYRIRRWRVEPQAIVELQPTNLDDTPFAFVDVLGPELALNVETRVEIDGERLVLGLGTAVGPNTRGAVWILERNAAGQYEFVTSLTPPENSAFFGVRLALDEDRVFVGSIGSQLEPYLPNDWRGALDVFRLDGAEARHEARIRPPHAPTRFGADLDVANGRVAVAARGFGGETGNVSIVAVDELLRGPRELSVGAPATQALLLRAGPQAAGAHYFVLGSFGGTTPGIAIGAHDVLPLVADAYFAATLLGWAPLTDHDGVLDAYGGADVRFEPDFAALGPAVRAFLVGKEVHHAALLVRLWPPLVDTTNAANAVFVE